MYEKEVVSMAQIYREYFCLVKAGVSQVKTQTMYIGI